VTLFIFVIKLTQSNIRISKFSITFGSIAAEKIYNQRTYSFLVVAQLAKYID